MHKFNHLFESLRINGLELKNRLVMAPMATRFAAFDGKVTPRLLSYYATRAQGGVGLVTVEATAVSPEGRGWGSNLCIYADKFLPGLAQLAEAIHQGGAKAAIEIFHAGRRAQTLVIGQQPVAPSAIPCTNGEVPKELSIEEINQLITDFSQAALRAKLAGFDVVTLHLTSGYLLQQFLSPFSNKRTDQYGGDSVGRSRLCVEIIAKVRELVGNAYPLFARLTGDEYISSGLNLAESQKIASILEKAGVDLIDVSAGGPEAPHKTVQPMTEARGCLVHLAEGIKEVVRIPVAVAGRINNPQLAEDILNRNQADLIVMGRPLIADPELPNKAMRGRQDEIRPCIACNQGCSDRLAQGVGISCLVNPLAGREGMINLQPTNQQKEIMVVGGGVAGMEAAIIAAQRGHKVTLLEKSNVLGGQALLAAKPPQKEEIKNLVIYLANQLDKKGVTVRSGVEGDIVEIEKANPDEILIATGSLPAIPDIPGVRHDQVSLAWEILKGTAIVGENVLIIGGGQVGCETAEYLLKQGKKVCIVEMGENIAPEMSARNRGLLSQRLIHIGAEILTRTRLVKIENKEAYVDQLGVELILTGFDDIIIAAGAKSYRPIDSAYFNSNIHFIGDCEKPARLLDAIHAGFRLGSVI